MKFDIITIFPKILDSYMNESIVRRAREKKLITVKVRNLRDYTTDKHHKVDDRPYGGGPGMVMKVEPIFKAVQKLKAKGKKVKVRTILFSTRGKKFDAAAAKRLSKYDQLIFICGRYEGVDERVAQYVADEEISLGDFVLAGGELPAMVVTEAVSRYIPGVLGKYESLEEVKGSFPSYTRPEVFSPQGKGKRKKVKVWRVPKVLTTGHHANIDIFRKK